MQASEVQSLNHYRETVRVSFPELIKATQVQSCHCLHYTAFAKFSLACGLHRNTVSCMLNLKYSFKNAFNADVKNKNLAISSFEHNLYGLGITYYSAISIFTQ